jgi:glucose/mannose-6-phosphate isomerase
MSMLNAIKDFPKQFEYEPKIENRGAFKIGKKFLICGMGGSALAGGLIKAIRPDLNLIVHKDYNLPTLSGFSDRLVLAVSYSGNTEETLSSFSLAIKHGINVVAISTGGKLIEEAKKNKTPYVIIPETGIQPRMGTGFMLRALLKLMGLEDELKESKSLATSLDPASLENTGKTIAQNLRDQIPIIYSSRQNKAVAYVWKIKLNETGKIPAFYNIFPELNHNEMTGYDVIPKTRALSKNIHFLFLRDKNDDRRIQKRMDITKKLYEQRGLKVTESWVEGKSVWEKIFQSLLVADWTAYCLSQYYGTEPEQVPLVEEFKKRMA